ncbi:MAG: ankyrin repeat domain-containing protein [Puniceicoccales bacterium]|jgi:hypothetical protein|nr:ankyrin repeat domain-containing protein [Puniceicoccales bacterium]
MNLLLTGIKKILWRDWDPIGMNAYSDAKDEYDTYASVLWLNYAQYEDFSKEYVYNYLMDISQNYMGLSNVNSDNTLSVAKKIFDLCKKYPKSGLDAIEIEKLKLLFDHPSASDWNKENLYWDNVLSYACKSGNLEVFKRALDHGGNIQQMDNRGITLLMFACYFGHMEIVKILLRQENSTIEYMDSKGNMALNYAIKGKNFDIVQLILEESRT